MSPQFILEFCCSRAVIIISHHFIVCSIYMYIDIYVCLYVCMYVCLFICMYVYKLNKVGISLLWHNFGIVEKKSTFLTIQGKNTSK